MHYFALALTVALPFALGPAQESIQLLPEEGLQLRKTMEFQLDLELTEILVRVNGEDQDVDVDMTLDYSGSATVLDRYVETAGGTVAVLEREYVELTGEMRISGDQEMEAPETSGLAGRTVRFTWDADDEEYDAKFTEDPQDEELLEDLVPLVDFQELLPDGDVEEGATWSVAAPLADRVFEPFGTLHLEIDDDQNSDDWGELMDAAVAQATGSFTVTLVRRYTEGDTPLAEMTFELDVEGSASATSTVEVVGEGGASDVDLDRTARLALELTGTLIWDLGANHARSLHSEGEIRASQNEVRQLVAGDNDVEIEVSRALVGTVRSSVEFEVVTE